MERKWWTLVAVCLATFMLLVDITIVNVALPSVQREMHASLTSLQWIVDAYALTLAALMLSAGTLADRFGRRRVFAGGVALFSIASLVCGLAGSATVLSLARAAQGVGGAAMFATSLALIAQEFTGPDRGSAIAAWSSTVGLGVAVGPLVGGILTEGLSWPWIFYVNVPIGGVAAAIAVLRLRDVRMPPRALDGGGLVTFSGGFFCLIYALLRGDADGWTSAPIVAAFAGAALLLTAFLAVERRRPQPMLDLTLFRKPAFAGVSLATFGVGAGMFAMVLYISLYLQDLLGFSALAAGLRLLPFSVLVLVLPFVTKRVAPRAAPRLLLGGGLLLVALGLLTMHGLGPGSGWTRLLGGLLIAGVGVGIANPAIGATALAVVEPMRSGMASGISNTCRLGGVATGVAALGAIFQSRITASLPHAHHGFAQALASGGTRALGHADPALVAAGRAAFADGMNAILFVGAATVAVGGLAALALVRARDFHGAPAAAQPAAPAAAAPAPEAVSA